jgi:hypothetical protein
MGANSQIRTTRIGRLARRLSPDVAPIRHSREFRLLYFGEAGSSAGVMICYVALPYQAYQISHSSRWHGANCGCCSRWPACWPGCLGRSGLRWTL